MLDPITLQLELSQKLALWSESFTNKTNIFEVHTEAGVTTLLKNSCRDDDWARVTKLLDLWTDTYGIRFNQGGVSLEIDFVYTWRNLVKEVLDFASWQNIRIWHVTDDEYELTLESNIPGLIGFSLNKEDENLRNQTRLAHRLHLWMKEYNIGGMADVVADAYQLDWWSDLQEIDYDEAKATWSIMDWFKHKMNNQES